MPKTMADVWAEQAAAKKAPAPPPAAPAPVAKAPPPAPAAPPAKSKTEPVATQSKPVAPPPAKPPAPKTPPPAKPVAKAPAPKTPPPATLAEAQADIAALSPAARAQKQREADAALAKLPPDLRASLDTPLQGVDPGHAADLRALQHATGTARGGLTETLQGPGDPDNLGATVRNAVGPAAFAAGRLALHDPQFVQDARKELGIDQLPSVTETKKLAASLTPAIDEAFVRDQATKGAAAALGPSDPLDRARVEHAAGPEMTAARKRAYEIETTPNMDRRRAVQTFLTQRTQELVNNQVLQKGGEDAIPSGPERDALEDTARQQAYAELVDLYKAGQFHFRVDPEDMNPYAAPKSDNATVRMLEATLPHNVATDVKGGSERAESIPWWFVNTVGFSTLYDMQGVFDYAAGDEFQASRERNMEERRDPATALLEADPNLRANLASGDPARVMDALTDKGFLSTMGIVLLTPDAFSAPVKGVQAAQATVEGLNRGRKLAARGSELAAAFNVAKAAGEAPAKAAVTAVKNVNAAVTAEEKAAAALKTQQNLAARIGRAQAAYAETGDIESAATVLEQQSRRYGNSLSPAEGRVLAKKLRDEYFDGLWQDPDVQAFLVHNKVESGRITPDRLRAVAVPLDTEERQAAAAARLEDLLKQQREIRRTVAEDVAAQVKAGANRTPGEWAGVEKKATAAVDAQVAEAKQEVAKYNALLQAKRGEEKWAAVSKQVGDDVLTRWGAIARGEEVGGVAAAPAPAPTPQAPTVDPDALARAFGGEVTPAQAQRIADAKTPEDLIVALRGLPAEVKDAVAKRLGAESFDALTTTMKGTDDEVTAARAAAQEKVVAARQAVLAAKDRYFALAAAPEDMARLAAARKTVLAAEKELSLAESTLEKAGVVKIGGRAKTRALGEAARLAEEELANLQRATHAPEYSEKLGKMRAHLEHQAEGIAAEEARTDAGFGRERFVTKARKALEQKIIAEQAVLDGMTVQDKARAARQANIDALQKQHTALEEAETAKWWDWRDEQERKVREYQEKLRTKYDDSVRVSAEGHATKHAAATAQAQEKATKARLAAEEAAALQAREEAESNAAFATATEARAAAEARVRAAQAAYDATPQPGVKRMPKGLKGEERIAAAQQAVLDANKAWSDAHDAAVEIDKLPEARENLRVALAAAGEEYRNLAAALGQQAEEIAQAQRAAKAPVPGVDPAVALLDNPETWMADYAAAARDVRRLSRGRVQTVAENAFNTLHDTWVPYGDLEEQSLTYAMRRIARRMEGGFKEVGEGLAHATDTLNAKATTPNAEAFKALTERLAYFKDGVAQGQMSGEYVALAATGYLNPEAVRTLSPAQRTQLVDLVRAWAADPESDILKLREDLLAASQAAMGDNVAGLRPPQEGDIFLAQAIGYGGVEREAVTAMQAQNLVYGADDAHAVNHAMTGTFDPTTATAGNPYAARGRRLAARVLVDPAAYRTKGIGLGEIGSATRRDVGQPLVQAVKAARGTVDAERTYGASAAALDDLDAMLLEVEKTMKGDLYVPRAIRDKILKQVDAAVATTELAGKLFDPSAYINFWKQVRVLGSGLSRPIQYVLDTASDYQRVATRASFSQAVKAAARSLPSQLLGVPGMAVFAALGDAARGAAGVKDARFGDTARWFDKWVNNLVFTAPVDKVLARSDEVVAGGYTGRQIAQEVSISGTAENFAANQATRSIAAATDKTPMAAGAALGAVSGGLTGAMLGANPWAAALGGAIFGLSPQGRALIAKNWRYLQDLQNVAASRRRVAILVGLLEAGVPLEEAGQQAVQIVGDFSRELGPVERKYFTAVFPFWSYGKFSARSAATSLVTAPYAAGVTARLGQGAAAGLSLVYNTLASGGTDEWGFHPTAMSTEPDPEEMERIRQEVAAEHDPEWDAAHPGDLEAEAHRRADGWGGDHPAVPRAMERYKRTVARLQTLPYDDAITMMHFNKIPESVLAPIRMQVWKDAKANGGDWDAERVEAEAFKRASDQWADVLHDWQTLSVYWAPNPTKAMLPAFAQNRPAVNLPKKRSQADEGYFNAGTGKYERGGDEARFALLPQDPLTEGLTVPLLTLAAGLNATPLADGTAFNDLVGGLFQDPVVGQAVAQLDLNSPEGMNTWVSIPASIGANLLPYADVLGLRRSDKLKHGQDVRADGTDKYESVYSLPASTILALYLLKPVIGEPTAVLDVAAAAEAAQGDTPFTRGDPDATDLASVYGWLLTGNRAYTASPAMAQGFADKAADKRLEAENLARGKVQPLPTSTPTQNLRAMSRVTPDQEGPVLQRLQAGGAYEGTDANVARAWLVRTQGADAREVAAMQDGDVLARVRAMK